MPQLVPSGACHPRRAQTFFSNHANSLRTGPGLALHARGPRHAAQRLHLVHLGRVHAGHCARGGGAHHRAECDERLSERGARPHAQRGLAHRDFFAPEHGPARCGTHAGRGPAKPQRDRRCTLCGCAGPAGARRGHEGHAGARHRPGARRRGDRPGRHQRRDAQAAGAGRVSRGAGRRAGPRPGRACRRRRDADRTGRAGDARWRGATPQADDGGGHV